MSRLKQINSKFSQLPTQVPPPSSNTLRLLENQALSAPTTSISRHLDINNMFAKQHSWNQEKRLLSSSQGGASTNRAADRKSEIMGQNSQQTNSLDLQKRNTTGEAPIVGSSRLEQLLPVPA